MEKPNFVYVTYIASTQEKVWQALIDADITHQYWFDPGNNKSAHVNISDWKVGSEWRHEQYNAERTVDIVGKVIEISPPKRLVLSWARPSEANDAFKHSQVTIEIDSYGEGLVRMIVTHVDLDPPMHMGISKGWPMILSNLKTFLESGHALSK
ncbi:SRPBCC family protein [Leptospira sp. GIMC2001]|uniref:SRPBCC family protein n=1 Tax=Leptospira sp. GIMC2001 TaxID=1513297 RepID=UPI002349B1C7|nr:SRPBCC family protein [Leptospira sp. GIMC2001]WCL50007.1 SRPBCC family protein [Leptospira sp. GIMC2001]